MSSLARYIVRTVLAYTVLVLLVLIALVGIRRILFRFNDRRVQDRGIS